MNHHEVMRQNHLKQVHLLMLKHKISFEELKEFAANYRSVADVMQARRDRSNAARKNAESLEKARAARTAKRMGVSNVQTFC